MQIIDFSLSLGCYNNYHRINGLNNTHLFLTVLGSWKSKNQVLEDLVFGESLLPGWQMAVFHGILHSTERRGKFSPVSSTDTNSIKRAPPSRANQVLKAPFQTVSTQELGPQHRNCGRTQIFRPSPFTQPPATPSRLSRFPNTFYHSSSPQSLNSFSHHL